MQKIETESGLIAYEECGAGMPVVLLHANAGDHHNYDAIIPALAQHYRVIAVDLPGFGGSDPCSPPSASSPMSMAASIDAFLAILDPGPAVFMGNSVGGYISTWMAITHPERALGLVLVDTGGFTAHTTVTRLFCRVKGIEAVVRLTDTGFAKNYLKRRNPFVEAIIGTTDAYRHDPARVAVNAALWRGFAQPDHDLRSRAAGIDAPTLLVWGEYDPVLRIADGALAESIIPGARLVAMKTGHMPFAEDPDGFLAIVMPFLEEVCENAFAPSYA